MKKILFFVLTLWALVILVAYYLSYPFPLIPILLELGLLTILLLLAICLGRKILRHFKVKFNSFFEEILFSIALGLGIISYSVLGLGLLGLLYGWLFSILLVILTIFLSSEVKETLKGIWQRVTSISWERFTPRNITLGAVIVGVILINFSGALAPSTSFDALVYHLAVPHIYIQHHRIIPLPYNLYSNFPLTGEMLYTLAMLLYNHILAHLIHFSLGLLTMLALFSFARRYFTQKTALLASCIFYTTPYVVHLSTAALVDLTLSFFIILGLYALINYFTSKKNSWLVLSALNCGFALGTKYTAILLSFALLLTGIILKMAIEDRERFSSIMKKVALFSLIAIGVASPWYLKNIVFTGNLVYPFFYKIFGGRYWNEFNAQRWMEHLRAQGLGYGNLKNYFKLPWAATMEARSFGSGLIGPFFLIFAPCLIFFKRFDKIIKYLIVYCILYFIFWALSQQYIRSLIPCLPFLSLIVAYLVSDFLSPTGKRHFFRIILSIVAIALLFNLFWVIIPQVYVNPLKVVFGLESKEEYINRDFPPYSVMNYINQNLPPSSKILFIGETRTFYCKRPFITDTAFDTTVIVEWVHSSSDVPELLKKLREEKITHILYNKREAERLERQFSYFNWKEKEDIEKYRYFINNCLKLLYAKNEVYLYRVNYGS